MRYVTRKIGQLARQAARAEDKPITLMFFAVGVIVTLIQYQDFLHTKRVTVSYDHIEQWEQDDYQAAFNRVAVTIRDYEKQARATVPEDLGDIAQLNFVQNRIREQSDAELGADLDRLIYFFDKLSVCIDQKLCHDTLLDQFFKGNLERLWIYSSGFIAGRRTTIDGYGELAEAYRDRLVLQETQ